MNFLSYPRRTARSIVLAGYLSFASSQLMAAELDVVLEQAKQHLRAENAQAAYELLLSHETEFTGQASFDYLLGVAALDSGNGGEAIFSLQRLVISKPKFAGARMELARAYFDVGNNELARTEFERVMQENPPQNVQQAVDQYMSAINARARSYRASSQWYLDIGGGYDDNPAAATADDQFLSFILNSKNVEQSSSFVELAIGGMYSRPVTRESQLMFTGRLSHRNNPSAHYVDPTSAELGASFVWDSGPNAASVGVTAMTFRLDGEDNRDDFGVAATYSRRFSEDWAFDVYGRTGRADYTDELEVQDVDQQMLGIGFTRSGERSSISAGFFATEDDARQTTSPFSSQGKGFRVNGTWIRPGGRSFTLEALALETDFDDPFFGLEREEDLYSITLSHSWQRLPIAGWLLTARIGYSEKDSTISLYDFDRLEAGILIRKVFD